MFSLEDIQGIKQGMQNEYKYVFVDGMRICEEMDKDYSYNERKQWNSSFLRNDLNLFREVYKDLYIVFVLIELLYEMETEHDQFVTQKMIQAVKTDFDFSIENVDSLIRRWGDPRNVWGDEKDKRYKEIGKRMLEFVEKAKRVIFEDILGE